MNVPTTSLIPKTTLSPDVAAELDMLLMPRIAPRLAPDEFTIHTLEIRYELNREMAKRMIDALVKEGRAEPIGLRREVRCPSQAWRLVKHAKGK